MTSVDTHDMTLPYLLRKFYEKEALVSYNWIDRGDKDGGDKAAVEKKRVLLNQLKPNLTVIIGEVEKDEVLQLYSGEVFGDEKEADHLDIAVYPEEGTTLLAGGQTNAMAVTATAPKGAMLDPGLAFYM